MATSYFVVYLRRSLKADERGRLLSWHLRSLKLDAIRREVSQYQPPAGTPFSDAGY